MSNFDLDSLVSAIRSRRDESVVEALSSFASDPAEFDHETVRRVATEGVSAMLRSPEPDYIYLQMRRFGKHAAPPALDAYQQLASGRSKVRTLLALLLVDSGEIHGLEDLTFEVKDKGKYAVPALLSLSGSRAFDLNELIVQLAEERAPGLADSRFPTPAVDEVVDALELLFRDRLHAYEERLRNLAAISENRFVIEVLDQLTNTLK